MNTTTLALTFGIVAGLAILAIALVALLRTQVTSTRVEMHSAQMNSLRTEDTDQRARMRDDSMRTQARLDSLVESSRAELARLTAGVSSVKMQLELLESRLAAGEPIHENHANGVHV